MKSLTAMLATALLCLSFAGQAAAQTTPTPVYVKKKIFVRIHWDNSFYNKWFSGSLIDLNAHAERYFDDVRRIYASNAALHNIELVLLDDFDRMTSPMLNYNDPDHWLAASTAGEPGGNARLINYMRANLSTSAYTRKVGNTTHTLGRIVNMVLIHQAAGSLAGEANSIGGVASSDANFFVTTSSGGFAWYRHTPRFALKEMPRREVLDAIVHELGHLLGGMHELADNCGRRGNNKGGDIMCLGVIERDRLFGAKNFPRTTDVMKRSLERCNTAFSNTNACNEHVNDVCSRILDYSQIAACQSSMNASLCSDICSTARKQTQVVVNGITWIVRENNRQPYRW